MRTVEVIQRVSMASPDRSWIAGEEWDADLSEAGRLHAAGHARIKDMAAYQAAVAAEEAEQAAAQAAAELEASDAESGGEGDAGDGTPPADPASGADGGAVEGKAKAAPKSKTKPAA